MILYVFSVSFGLLEGAPANTNDCVFYSDVKKTQGFSLTAVYPKLIPTHPKSFNVLSLFSFYFTILNIQTRGFQLYCSPQPDSDWQVFAEPHWIVRHETYGSPTLLSCPPSHESFVAEVQVAGAVRSLSEQQEEASTLTRTQIPSLLQHQPSDTLTVNPPVSMSAVINFPDFQCAGELPLCSLPLAGDFH